MAKQAQEANIMMTNNIFSIYYKFVWDVPFKIIDINVRTMTGKTNIPHLLPYFSLESCNEVAKKPMLQLL